MSYAEAAELSYFGAKVLHPRTVQPLAVRGIPIHVRNTTAASRRGTAIVADGDLLSRVAAVAAVEDVTILEVRADVESADGLQMPRGAVVDRRCAGRDPGRLPGLVRRLIASRGADRKG